MELMMMKKKKSISSSSSSSIPFIHKALAKVTGGYSNLSGCPLRQILSILLGCPPHDDLQRNFHQAKHFEDSSSSKYKFTQELLSHFFQGDVEVDDKNAKKNVSPIFLTKSNTSSSQSSSFFGLNSIVGYCISQFVVAANNN